MPINHDSTTSGPTSIIPAHVFASTKPYNLCTIPWCFPIPYTTQPCSHQCLGEHAVRHCTLPPLVSSPLITATRLLVLTPSAELLEVRQRSRLVRSVARRLHTSKRLAAEHHARADARHVRPVPTTHVISLRTIRTNVQIRARTAHSLRRMQPGLCTRAHRGGGLAPSGQVRPQRRRGRRRPR